ncbi:MAG: O-antigen ligase family protein [Candidatus Alkaliphilus sp. MAG34]|nr:polymerase [Clostridiales bacterium]
MKKNRGFTGILIIGLILGIISGKIGICYGIVLGMAVIFMVSLVFKPHLSLYVLAGYSFVDYIFRYSGGLVSGLWDELLFIVMVGAFLINLIVTSKGFEYRLTSMDMPIIVFGGVSIFLLLINSPDMYIALEGARVMLQHIVWYFAAVNIVKDKNIAKNVIKLLILITFIISLHGIYQYIVGVEIPSSWYDSAESGMRTRVFSIIGSPNILGGLLVLVFPITLAFGFNEIKPFKKIIYFLMTMSMMLCLVFTFSRGAWLAFCFVAVVFAILKDKRLIIPIVIGVIVLVIALPEIGNRMLYMFSPVYFASSAKGGRIIRWVQAIETIKTGPLLGVGLGRYGGATAMRYIPGSVYTDNFYLKTMAEMGVVGFIAFIFMLYRVVIESLKTIRYAEDSDTTNISIGIFTGLLGVLAHNLVENVFEVPMMTSYFWLLAAIMILFNKHITNKGDCDEKEYICS